MKSKRLMTIGIVLALLIAVVGVVLSVSLTACGKDVITVRSEKELLKAAGTSQEKTIVLMDDVVVNGDLKVAAPNKIDLNGFGLEVKGTLSADGSGTLVVGTTALILARRETVKAQKIDINMPQGHVEWNANIELPASAAASADAMTVVTSASSFVFKGVFKIGGAEADIMLTLKGGRFEISNLSESSAATVLVPEQAVGAAVENLSQGAMRVEAHSDVAVGGEVEISSKNSEVNVTALESQAETKITVTDGTVKKIDAAGAQVVVAESAQAGDVVAEKLENNGTVTGAVVADEIVNNGTLEEENVNAALKTAAKKALNDSFATYSQDDYTSDNWAKLTKAKDDGLAAIDSALTEAAIQSAKNAALDAMAAVETIAEATAEAKAAATAALKTAFEGYTETDYDAQTWATLKAAYDNGLAAIEAATDVSAVNTAKQTALDAMAACVPKDVEALTQAKAEAKAAIETAFKAYDEDDYASANWTELTIAYNKGLNEVDAATSVSAVNAAKQKALDAMAAVKNNATLLAEAKTAALAALDAAKAEYSQADYATNWSVLEKAYNDGKTEINAAVAIEAVNSALQKATDAMAAVKNDATLLAEAKTAATDQLNSEYAKYKATDYTNANYELLTEKYNAGLSAIGGARTVDAVETALETAVAEMAAIKTNAQILADAKAAAKQAVNEAFAAYNEQDYTVDNWSALVKVKDDGLAAIEAAAKTDVAAEAGEAAIAAMAAVKNNATLLAEAKATAKSELETEYKKYKKTDYTANWSQLESAYNSGLTAIENAATIELAQAAKEEAVTAMAAVKNDATLLAEAKTAAKSELGTEKAKYSQSDYTINWSVLEQAYNDGLAAIDASKTTSAVDTAKQAAIAAMAAVKTDAEELEAAKSAAKDELKEYFDAFNKAYYYETSLQALQTAYDSGVSAISAAQSVADVATALANAKTALDNVKADVTEVNDADSLKAAVEAQYSKIILTANISGAYIEVNYDLTLDLNGFGLVLEDRTNAAVNVNGGASFTLCDGSAAKSGKIKSDYAGIIAIGSDADKAVVEINGGTIEVDNSAYWSNGASNVGYAVYANNAEVEMWGGEIIAKGQYVKEDDSVFGINLRNGSSATVHAGKIKSDTYGVVVYYNSAFTLDGGEIEGATAIEMRAGKLVVNSGTMIGNGDPFESDPNGNGATTLGAAVAAVQHTTKLDLSVEINGGTLQGARAFYQANLQNNGKEALEKISITLGKSAVYDGEIIVDSAEATIEDDQSTRYYMTLQQAVDAAEDDETVVVVKDLSASGAEYFITLDDESKTVTVDLNGKTLLYTGSGTGSNPQNGEAISVSAGKLVLKNGTVNMVNDEAGSVYWGIRVHGTGSLAMSKVTVKSEDSPLFMSAVSAGGKIYLTLDECHIEGVYSAVYMNGSTSPAEITINNSTIVSKDVGIYVSNSVNTGNRQKLTITDSTVTGTTAIEVKHTDATITGCTLISTAAEQKSQINGNGSCTEGFAFAVTGNGDADKTTGTVVVSGCKFYNGKPSSTDAEENGFYFVFTTAEGASVTVDGAAADETAAYGAYEARVSNAWFDTFENAVKYAEANGKTVVLLKDVEVGEAGNDATGLVVSGTLTVDFNGFTVSNVGTGYAVVVSGSDAKVTLIDSSEEQTGGIYGGSGGDNQALRVESGATLDIYGGNYNVGGDAQGKGNSTVAIRTNSTVNIYGGRFASEKAYKGKYFVLNVQQTTGASGFIKVYGGTFVGQNPADGDDALGGSFVAKGYEAFVSKEATDDSLAEYTVGKVYEAGSEEALRGAIAAAQGFSVVRLTADVDLKEELYINGVDLMLDLNGFTLSLHYGEGVKRKNCSTLYVANATLIINDSSEDKSGRVENTDTTGGTNLSSKDNNYAVRVGREANLIINGGTFYTSADSAGNGNSVILIYSTSSNESTVTINGGVFETEAAYNGTYFVLNVQDGFKGGYVVCGGTFKGYKPGTTNTGELATVPEGYEIAEQEIENGVVWYTVQKAQ